MFQEFFRSRFLENVIITFQTINNHVLGGVDLLNSMAISKMQAVLLAAIIIVATLSGGFAYVLLSGSRETQDTIKIGLCADLNMPLGKGAYQGLLLAAEQINEEGGLLGKQVEIVGEDSDSEEKGDPATIIQAFKRLLFQHEVDFTIGSGMETYLLDAAAEHKTIMLGTAMGSEQSTQSLH